MVMGVGAMVSVTPRISTKLDGIDVRRTDIVHFTSTDVPAFETANRGRAQNRAPVRGRVADRRGRTR
jgi:hypothetical protein